MRKLFGIMFVLFNGTLFFIGCTVSNTAYNDDNTLYPGGTVRPSFIDTRSATEIEASRIKSCEPVRLDPAVTRGAKYALVVGISAYPYPNMLQYCDDDANDWAIRLQKEGYSVTKIIDAQATYTKIDAAITALASKAIAGNDIVLVYSGHGDYSGSTSYMISVDIKYMSNTYLTQKFANAASTKMIFSFDCCFAGGFSSLKKTGRIVALGSTNTYSWDGSTSMANGVYTYYQMRGFDAYGYIYMEDDASYANTQMRAWGSANRASVNPTYYDLYTGKLDL
jgi:hypothetical protein